MMIEKTLWRIANFKKSLMLLFFCCAILPTALTAKEAAPLATNPLVEKRLQTISSELRCLVCQNESLAGSQAALANDLRDTIRGMIEAGESDTAIMDFMVSRYGDFVRYRPPLKTSTLFLWGGPLLFLLGGLGALFWTLRSRAKAVQPPLSEAEATEAAKRLEPAATPEKALGE